MTDNFYNRQPQVKQEKRTFRWDNACIALGVVICLLSLSIYFVDSRIHQEYSLSDSTLGEYNLSSQYVQVKAPEKFVFSGSIDVEGQPVDFYLEMDGINGTQALKLFREVDDVFRKE